MKHYICQFIFEIQVDNMHKGFDEINVYFFEESKTELVKKIELKSAELESEFMSEYNKLVTWNYIGLLNVFEFNDLKNGMELFSSELGHKDTIEKEELLRKIQYSTIQ